MSREALRTELDRQGGRAIIGYHGDPDLWDEIDLEDLGIEVSHRYHIIPAFEVVIPLDGLDWVLDELEWNARIEIVEPDFELSVDVLPDDPFFSLMYGLHNTGQTGGLDDNDIDAPEAWDLTTGDPEVLVAVIDTGVQITHPELADNVWVNAGEVPDDGIDNDGNGFIDDVNGWNFYDDTNEVYVSASEDDHGTHVFGTIAARGDNGTGVVGVAWETQVMALKFLGPGGSGWTSDAIEAIEYAADWGVPIMSNSWGGGGFSLSLYNAIDNCDCVFVAAAGNDKEDTDLSPHYPSSYDLANIISVAALDDDAELATGWGSSGNLGSNWGLESVDLAAHGDRIWSTVPTSTYARFSGTSMATPHVSGVAALMLSVNPELTTDELIEAILTTVDPLSSLSGLTVTGGRLNAYSAVTAVLPGCESDEDCDDGAFCNGEETCVDDVCLPGSAVDCDDGVGCTVDECDEETDTCESSPSDAPCDNGVYCDGQEQCHALDGCQPGTEVDCDDSIACTADDCNEVADECDHVPNDLLCSDGDFCSGVEACTVGVGCEEGSDPCAGLFCSEPLDSCVECLVDLHCSDGLFCTGAETCDGTGTCQSGADPCPGEMCAEATDSCVECLVDGDCDDGLWCNGAETCGEGGSCQLGTDPCSGALCAEDLDSCVECLEQSDCDDGLWCNGSESCVAGACEPGTPPDCGDSVACTVDSCVESDDSCAHEADDGLCDNGAFCDGDEVCDAEAGCQDAESPCGPDQICNEEETTCEDIPLPRLEAGTVEVGGTHVTVPLVNTYDSPVVVCSVQYDHNSLPVVTRVSNVTATSFDVRLQNPSNSAVLVETVNYLVVEEGSWEIGGLKIEARAYVSTRTGSQGSWSASNEVQAYAQSYENPVVLGQVMSESDPDWSVFWCRGEDTPTPPSASALSTGKMVGEDPDGTREDETIGYVVIEAGHRFVDGIELEAGLTADVVVGVQNAGGQGVPFATPFTSAPQVLLTTMAGIDGGNGAWSQSHGATGPSAAGPQASRTHMSLSVDEDQTADQERRHTNEQVGYLALAVPFAFGQECEVDADCDDAIFCNGQEACVDGRCAAADPVDCNDGVGCTVDACVELTASCENTPDDGACDNGLLCDGSETCDLFGDCQAGEAVQCDDGVECTVDVCVEPTGTCQSVADHSACDNGQFCDGQEVCDPVEGCGSGEPVSCALPDDPCNAGFCDEEADACSASPEPEGTTCDDGDLCTEGDECDGAGGCSGAAVCHVPVLRLVLKSDRTRVDGLVVADEDIVEYDFATDTFSLLFDGSDVGLPWSAEIDGFAQTAQGELVLSFGAALSIPGLEGGPDGDAVDDSDLVLFTPTALGSHTEGTFSFLFDGSDVGLTDGGEDVVGVAVTPDEDLLLTTSGTATVPGLTRRDEDVLRFAPTSLGAETAGEWTIYFDGSDVGLSGPSDDVDAVGLTPEGELLLSTTSPVSLPDLSASDVDVILFEADSLGSSTSGTFSLYFDGGAQGLAAGDIGALQLGP